MLVRSVAADERGRRERDGRKRKDIFADDAFDELDGCHVLNTLPLMMAAHEWREVIRVVADDIPSTSGGSRVPDWDVIRIAQLRPRFGTAVAVQ